MKKIIVILLAILKFGSSYSQVPTIQTNTKWLKELDSLTDKQSKIKFVINKIKTDSVYKSDVKLSTYISSNGHLHDKIGNEVPCKIIFTLKQKKTMYLLDLSMFPNYSAILEYFDSDTISEIQIVDGAAATAIFGTRGNCGVVILKSNDRKLRKLLRKI